MLLRFLVTDRCCWVLPQSHIFHSDGIAGDKRIALMFFPLLFYAGDLIWSLLKFKSSASCLKGHLKQKCAKTLNMSLWTSHECCEFSPQWAKAHASAPKGCTFLKFPLFSKMSWFATKACDMKNTRPQMYFTCYCRLSSETLVANHKWQI